MQRYFAQKIENNIVLESDDIFHILNVMRSQIGDEFEIVADSKLYIAKLINAKPFQFEITKEVKENHELDGYIRLLYCLPKGEKLDLVMQKAVEIGAKEIVLVNSSRCVRKFNQDEYNKKKNRFLKIVKEASEQCKRTSLMKIDDVIDYKNIGNYKADYSFICYEKCADDEKSFYDYLKNIKGKTVNILIGSEGGFSQEEVDYAIKRNYISVSLGNRILRSETSCFYALSLLSFFMEVE